MKNFIRNVTLKRSEKTLEKSKEVLPDIPSKKIIDKFIKNIENLRLKFDIFDVLKENNFKKKQMMFWEVK